MEGLFSELVLRGNFPLVKGFLVGFLCGRNSEANYFFCHSAGTIRRDTVGGMIRQLAEVDSDVRVCLETSVVGELHNAVYRAHAKIGIELIQVEPITTAEFECACELYNEEDGRSCKEIFRAAQERLQVIDFREREIIDNKAGNKAHPYTYKGKGHIKGDFGNVMDVFLQMKRAPFRDFIRVSEMMIYHS